MAETRNLTAEQTKELLQLLKARFDSNMNRHEGVEWASVKAKLESKPEKRRSLFEMEKSGGEPDVVGYGAHSDEFIFFDCSPESPVGRRNLCYDHDALVSRKKNKPESSAMDMASAMGIDILTEEQYRELQKSGEYDTKTSSWIITPPDIRKLGGALFCDRRYNHVFVYHNGAESYYGARGFRGSLKV